MRRLILSIPAIALLATAGPAPLIASKEKVEAQTSARQEPLCKIYGSDRVAYESVSYSSPPPPPPIPAPPPPPPPPPPLARPATESQTVVVTGQRAQQQSVHSVPTAVSVVSEEHKSSTTDASAAAPNSRPAPWPGRYGYLPLPPENRERYEGEDVAGIQRVANAPVSTFAVDVDTGAYANVRRFLTQGQMPPQAAVRTEEMVNYFRYDYPLPQDREQPFSVTTDMAASPWNADTKLLRVGLRGYDLDYKERPAANLVFLVDVSGSMGSPDKLPLVKSSLAMLADQIRPQDRVSLVVYAGAAGTVLSPCNKPEIIKQALNNLDAGGSTAGGAGLKLAYATARQNFKAGSVNRILVATDGDFNVGITDNSELKDYVAKERENGVTLTTLGFGTGNYNEALMEEIANVGNGNYAYIDSAMEAQKVLSEEMSSTLFTIAKDVKIQIEFNPAAVKEYRLIGYENRLLAEEDFDNDAVDAGDIGAGHQVTAIYEIVPANSKGWLPERRYEKPRQMPDVASSEMGFIKLRYKLPDGKTSRLIEQPLALSMLDTSAKPSGDMAFATAVAAFGQKLRGDKYLSAYSFADIRALAGADNGNFWRQEFVKLTQLAATKN